MGAEQAQALRARHWNQIDAEPMAEKVEAQVSADAYERAARETGRHSRSAKKAETLLTLNVSLKFLAFGCILEKIRRVRTGR